MLVERPESAPPAGSFSSGSFSSGFSSVEIRSRLKVPIDADSPAVVTEIAEHSRKFIEGILDTGAAPVVALGVGVAGLVTLEGTVSRSPNVAGVVNQDLRGAIESTTGLRPTVDNDANCVAFAAACEGQDGQGPPGTVGGDDVVLAVTLGTGIGGGLVVNGSLLQGADGYASEPGHMVVDPGGIQCRCGQLGCWERYASGTAIERLAADAVEQGWSPTDADGRRILPGSRIRSEQVVRLARSGDEIAMSLMAQFAQWLGFGLQNLIGVLNPTRIVLSGGLSEEADLYLPLVLREAAQNPQLVGHAKEISVAPYGEAAGAVGAGMLAITEGMTEGMTRAINR